MQTNDKNELLSTTAISSDDSFAGFVDTYEGEDEIVNQRMIQGTRIKFSNEGKWTDNQGIELDPGKHYLAIGVERVVNKWPVEQGPPLETIVLAPGQPFPNIDKMNKACPKSEWREAFGKQVGPYKPQRLLYLLDRLMTLDKYTFPTSTVGGTRAVHELADKIAWMRRYRQAGVRPLVQLSTTFMPTQYGGRQRPHFIIVDWIAPSGGDVKLEHKPTPQISGPAEAAAGADVSTPATSATPATPATPATSTNSSAKSSTKSSAKPSKETLAKAGLKTVSEPSLAEEMSDDIPF